MNDEEKIRRRAYELWELERRREGAGQDHWRNAREQLKRRHSTGSQQHSGLGGQTQPDRNSRNAGPSLV